MSSLKPIRFSKGKANKMLDIFTKLYPLSEKVRHVIWITDDKIFIQKTVSTRNVNELLLENPSQTDETIIRAFGEENDEISAFLIDKIEMDENDNGY